MCAVAAPKRVPTVIVHVIRFFFFRTGFFFSFRFRQHLSSFSVAGSRIGRTRWRFTAKEIRTEQQWATASDGSSLNRSRTRDYCFHVAPPERRKRRTHCPSAFRRTSGLATMAAQMLRWLSRLGSVKTRVFRAPRKTSNTFLPNIIIVLSDGLGFGTANALIYRYVVRIISGTSRCAWNACWNGAVSHVSARNDNNFVLCTTDYYAVRV